MNHRFTLRVATNLTLFIFLCFSIGLLLWIADEFLGWNLLPDAIDAYAQLIVVAMGVTAGLAVATSFMCGLAVIAESAATKADIHDYKTSRKTWKLGGVLIVTALVALFGLNQIDRYRKRLAQQEAVARYEAEFFKTTNELNLATPQIIDQLTPELLNSISSASVTDDLPRLTTFFGSVQSSTQAEPSVTVLVRAAEPYRYCLLKLVKAYHNNRERYIAGDRIEKQFYLGLPTEQESELIEQLFAGAIEPIRSPLEGEVINNTHPGTWGLVKSNDATVGLLMLRTGQGPRHDVFHAGPATPSGRPIN